MRFRKYLLGLTVLTLALLVAPPATAMTAPATTTTMTWSDEFDGTSLDTARWGSFNGDRAPQYWQTSQVRVHDGMLSLTAAPGPAGHWITGAISNARSFRQTYGRWEMRVRTSAGPGVRGTALLWPAGAGAPPEVDFYELPGSDAERYWNTVTAHYGGNYGSGHHQVWNRYAPPAGGTFTDWHTVGVIWTPTRLDFTCDGQILDSVTNAAAIPHQPMWVGIQQGLGWQIRTQPVTMDVDYIRIYTS